jgi:hypothetical protein
VKPSSRWSDKGADTPALLIPLPNGGNHRRQKSHSSGFDSERGPHIGKQVTCRCPILSFSLGVVKN